MNTEQLDKFGAEISGVLYQFIVRPSGVWKFIYVSPGITALYGISPEEACADHTALTRFIIDDDLEAYKASREHATQTLSFWQHEHRMRSTSGDQKWVRVQAVPEQQPDGSVLWSGMLSDISANKRAEEELRLAKAEADRANSAKSRFLAAASHDLRQPLAALSLYVGLLKKKVAPAQGKLVADIESCAASLSELLNDLLDVSKLEAGVVVPKPTDFALDEMLNALTSVHAAEARVKGLQLRARRSSIAVRTDRQLLQRIVGNLLANAIAYTDAGGVLVACRRHQGRFWVEIWDTGLGIPADKTELIFEEFRQLDDGARNRGSGLGLAIVAKTAALLGLKVRLRSRLARGSMFAVELPLGQAPPAESTPVACSAAMALRIALVEDNARLLAVLATSLGESGHAVVAASSGEELIERLDGLAPDIVVSDYRLAAKETGVEVISAVRKHFGKAVPALLITGDTDPALVRSMASRGIAVHFKPMQIDALLGYISAATAPPAP